MPEADSVNKVEHPNTVLTLSQNFSDLGLKPGDVVLMHSAMGKLGWTVGGPVAVIDALLEVLTPRGTLVMPTHTTDNSEPSYWENPPVPESWWPVIRQQMPAFRPEVTPTRMMGAIPELFRTYPNVLRSNHPAYSFAAWGQYAQFVIDGHELEASLGEQSPLARVYDLEGKVLLLGVNHENNTSLHLAEHRASYPAKITVKQGAAWMLGGQRRWVEWEELAYDEDDFAELGTAFEQSIGYTPGKVGAAEARLVSQRAVVDFAVGWLTANRKQAVSEE
jgi:aminoglycoside 3-N-acetyltransferase